MSENHTINRRGRYLNKTQQQDIAYILFHATSHLDPWVRDEIFDKMGRGILHNNRIANNLRPDGFRQTGELAVHAFIKRLDELKQSDNFKRKSSTHYEGDSYGQDDTGYYHGLND